MGITHEEAVRKLHHIDILTTEEGEKIYKDSLKALSKKKELGFAEYVDQLEKNLPYNYLLYLFSNSMIENYIKNNTELSGKIAYESLASHAQKLASAASIAPINYLRYGTDDNAEHSKVFDTMRKIKLEEPNRYIEELEFALSCYKSRYIVSNLFLHTISHPQYDDFRHFFAKNFTSSELFELIEDRFKSIGNLIIGNIAIPQKNH